MELEINYGKTVEKFNELIENPDSFDKLCGLICTESLIPRLERYDIFKIKYQEVSFYIELREHFFSIISNV
jgi:hypothetical protein